MFGQTEIENFEGNVVKLPQDAASAWSELDAIKECGAGYKPLLYVGKQLVKGVNYWFIAEQTLITKNNERRIVKIAVNHFEGKYTVIPHSLSVIDFAL